MPQSSWSGKRERQYDHIVEGPKTKAGLRRRPSRSRPAWSTRSGPAMPSQTLPSVLRSTTFPQADGAGFAHTRVREDRLSRSCTTRPSDGA